ncbi:MAG TPA: hypothetical protein PLD84_13175, partial [Chitinophagales bacterium]|nr:hypothetical protein [Chitinophagales bacterium]
FLIIPPRASSTFVIQTNACASVELAVSLLVSPDNFCCHVIFFLTAFQPNPSTKSSLRQMDG